MDKHVLSETIRTGLREYGFYSEPLSDKWRQYEESYAADRTLAVALNNSDRTFVSLELFRHDFSNFIDGTRRICEAFDIQSILVFFPKEFSKSMLETAGRIKEALTGTKVSVSFSKPDVLYTCRKYLIHHPETLENIGRLENGMEAKRFVRVANGKNEKTVHADLDAGIKDIVSAAGFETPKYVLAGGEYGELVSPAKMSGPFLGFGNSVIEIVSEKFCVVDTALKCGGYGYENTCGKCSFCREGNYQLMQFMKRASEKRADAQDIKWLEVVAKAAAEQSGCSFGRESARFVLSTIGPFKSDYESHFRLKRCPANICLGYVDLAIDGNKCNGCGKCLDSCKEGAISKSGGTFAISMSECTKCGMCETVCPQSAVIRVREGNAPIPAPGCGAHSGREKPVRPLGRRRYR